MCQTAVRAAILGCWIDQRGAIAGKRITRRKGDSVRQAICFLLVVSLSATGLAETSTPATRSWANASRPEVYIFMLMRNLAVVSGGKSVFLCQFFAAADRFFVEVQK